MKYLTSMCLLVLIFGCVTCFIMGYYFGRCAGDKKSEHIKNELERLKRICVEHKYI